MLNGTDLRKTISIGTDVATFMVFHPGDLAGRDDWPIAWWSQGFAYAPLAAAGHLLAFGVGSDGGYVVRLAHTPGGRDPLSDEERSLLAVLFDVRCEVRHGGVYLTNDDALPGEESRPFDELTASRFFELPNGLYRLTVHGIDLSTLRSQRKLTDDDADFVIAFTPVDRADFEAVHPAYEPPQMRPTGEGGKPGNVQRMHGGATLTDHQGAFLLSASGDDGSLQPAKAVLDGGSFLRLPVDDVVLPDESQGFDVPERWFEKLRAEDSWSTFVLMAPASEAKDLAMVCWVHGRSEHPARDGAPARYVVRVRGCFPVRLARPGALERARRWLRFGAPRAENQPEGAARIALPAGTVLVLRRDEERTNLDVSDLRNRILALIDLDAASPVLGKRPRSPSYEKAAVAAADDPMALLDWLLRHLDISAHERLALWPEPVEVRSRVLVGKLRSLT